MTLDEVAADLGITASRVRQIERRALSKLRHLCTKRLMALDDYIDVIEIASPKYLIK